MKEADQPESSVSPEIVEARIGWNNEMAGHLELRKQGLLEEVARLEGQIYGINTDSARLRGVLLGMKRRRPQFREINTDQDVQMRAFVPIRKPKPL